jgi:hypothetical protein
MVTGYVSTRYNKFFLCLAIGSSAGGLYSEGIKVDVRSSSEAILNRKSVEFY